MTNAGGHPLTLPRLNLVIPNFYIFLGYHKSTPCKAGDRISGSGMMDIRKLVGRLGSVYDDTAMLDLDEADEGVDIRELV